jgi:signal transduction histidine kinase/ActR/RegA family two-component response regulator
MAEADPSFETEAPTLSWRRIWMTAAAIIVALILAALLLAVTLTNRARDSALAWERHTYQVMLLTRTVDDTMARAEATLARFVLDENPQTGRLYSSQWRQAGRQIALLQMKLRHDPEQTRRIEQLRQLYRQRGAEFSAAATSALEKKDSGGVPRFYAAGLSPNGPAIRDTLDAIAAEERANLSRRMEQTRRWDEQADRFTGWLSWFGILIGLLAIVLGLMAYRLITERVIARQEAESEASRALSLERAVQDRTRELRDANERLRAEATERAAAEAQLRQVQKMEAVGQLTGGIAHDFNNMLAVIVGGIDLARRKLRGPRRDVEFHLDSAMEGATRAAALTRRLLAFSRSETLLPQAVVPSELVKGMLELVDRSLGERITVETRFPREPWRVWADTNQLENAVLNLCVNARDAMNGDGQVGIWVDNVSLYQDQVGELPAGDYVRISIADTGTGIEPEHLERVFEPFFTTKPVGKGTGLGLSQIFGFARQSGGDVAIDSTVGVGTTVSVYLPRSLRTPAAGAAEAGQPRDYVADGELPSQSGTTILVVEDDPRVSRATVGSLEELGYVPIACSSGREALNILQLHPEIDLVITDVMMPEMTGPELVRIIAERHPDVAILFVTGFVGEAGEAEELTGYDLLRKPFTVAALANAAAAALARRGRGFSEQPPASASEAAE